MKKSLNIAKQQILTSKVTAKYANK